MSVMSDLDLKSQQVFDELSHMTIKDWERREKNGVKASEIVYIHSQATCRLFAMTLAMLPDESLREDIITHFRYLLGEGIRIAREDNETETIGSKPSSTP